MSVALIAALALALASFAGDGPFAKAPGFGIVLGHLRPGPVDAITDVAGVKVGHVTHVEGAGALRRGHGPFRTGVTAIVPRDDVWHRKVFAASWDLNGNGEMTGVHWVDEAGWLEQPILLTDTLSVGRVADGVVSWMIARYPDIGVGDDVPLPVVAEIDDGYLNDQQGRRNTAADAVAALRKAHGGPIEQGAVGAGTGAESFGFKGGIGTASRVLAAADGGYTVGVLVNTNTGRRPELTIDGVPVGRELPRPLAFDPRAGDGSIIVVIATDAPLLHDQLSRLCRRAALGIARMGATSRNGSGDLVLAFSTANVVPHYPDARTFLVTALDNYHINQLFDATIEATNEAMLNALLAAHTIAGRDGHTAYALPHERLRDIMTRHGR